MIISNSKNVQIRNGVFETNSSSSHSISFTRTHRRNYHFYNINDENKIVVKLGEYGWGYDTLTSPDEKLSYILTMIAQSVLERWNLNKVSAENIQADFQFQDIEKLILDNTEYKGIVLDKDVYNGGDFYIDHQSFYMDYRYFLDDYKVTLENYLFDNSVIVIIDNDNYPHYEDDEEDWEIAKNFGGIE